MFWAVTNECWYGCQMKDEDAAQVWNSRNPKHKLLPIPGSSVGNTNDDDGNDGKKRTPAYISCSPEYQAEKIVDGFVILACDGVWDEVKQRPQHCSDPLLSPPFSLHFCSCRRIVLLSHHAVNFTDSFRHYH